MFHRFVYESEFYPNLSRVPMYVRMKLDLTGVTISLDDWLAFSFEERTALCHLPIDTEEERQVFISYLDFLSRKYRGGPLALTQPVDSSLWNDLGKVPPAVIDKSALKGRAVTREEWTQWKFHQRYALYKTAIAKRDTEAFFALLSELRGSNS
jgi:hypothetical protein